MKIGKIYILLEVSLISTHLVLPQEVHIEKVLHIFGYLKTHNNMRIVLDFRYPRFSSDINKEYERFDLYKDAKEVIPSKMPESREHRISISMFVDS